MGRPAVVTREDVLRAAQQVLDDEGNASLSIERIARRLGVRGPSIYHHFTNKAELLGELSRSVLGDLGVRRPSDSWREWMVMICLTFYRRVLDHPGSAVLLLEHLTDWATVSGFGVAAQVLSRAGVDPAIQLLVLEGSEKLTWGWALKRAMSLSQGADDPEVRWADEERLAATLHAFLAGAVGESGAVERA